jgi:hypothetical protein
VGASLAADASNRAFWQQVTLTAVTTAVSAYVRNGGAAVSATDMQLCAVAGTSTPVGTLLTTTFTALTGGWYRATATFTGTAAAWTVGVAVKANKTVVADCLQVEARPEASSYIPTTSATATRNKDDAQISTAAWTANAGTLVGVFGTPAHDAYPRLWGVTSQTIQSYRTQANLRPNVYGGDNALMSPNGWTAWTTGTNGVAAVSWSGTSANAYVNGTAGATGTIVARTGNGSTLAIGAVGADCYDGPVQRIVVYASALAPTVLDDADMTTDLLAGVV